MTSSLRDKIHKIVFAFSRRYMLFLVFIFSLGMLHGPSFNVMHNFDTSSHPDSQTYLNLANFNLNESPIRRYRVLVPFAAAGIEAIAGPVFKQLEPDDLKGNFSIKMSFLIINNLLMALFGLFIFRLCYRYSGQILASFLAMAAVLSSRWTAYFAGLPLADSLYLLVAVLLIFAIETRNKKLTVLLIFLGPWSKEAFIFLAPVLFFFAPVNKGKQIVLFLISGLLVFGFRYWVDQHIGASSGESLVKDIEHFKRIPKAIARLFSFHGLYEILSLTGIFIVLFLFPLFEKGFYRNLFRQFPPFYFWFIVSVIFQALLSMELSRFLYMAMPVYGILLSIILAKFGGLKLTTTN